MRINMDTTRVPKERENKDNMEEDSGKGERKAG